MFSRRSDFGIISTEVVTDRTWLVAQQTGATGLTQVVVVTTCVCGTELGRAVTVFTSGLVLDCSNCRAELWVPQVVEDRAVKRESKLMSDAADIRAANGGSGLMIPDC